MLRSFKYSLLATLVFLTLAGGMALAALPTIMDEKDVLPYLEKMISWHRQAVTLDTSPEIPRELIIKSTLQQHTAAALDGSFTFARALVDILPIALPQPAVTEEKVENATKEIGIKKAISLAVQQTQQLQAALEHATLHKDRERLAGLIKLEQEHINVLKEIAETNGVSSNEENDTLPYKINQLAGTISEVDATQQKTASGTPDTSAQNTAASSTNGIVGLATKIYSFMQARSAVKALLNDTTNMWNDNKDRSQIIRDALKNIMQEGQTLGAPAPKAPETKQPGTKIPSLAATATKTPPAAAAAPPQATYDDLVSDMKKLSKVAVALSQTNTALKLCTHDLSDWVDLINIHIKDLTSNLIFRLSMLGLAIAIALMLALLARKATKRYVVDKRRKDQLRVIRKVTLSITIGIILFLAFFTDLGSLATFAGLLTAGVAFATKDMILSLIAYFQFFGTSDIQLGDDITIAGVTGKISHIGMLRFYMMETDKSDTGYLPTGRIVGFSNSVLFQPTPFFRQSPGTNFVWSEIDISLGVDIDHALAYKKLNEVVQRVYKEQSEKIQLHEAALQKVSPFKTDVSVPLTHFRFTNTGVVFVIRYAVERSEASRLHFKMTTELLSAIKKDPDLKVMHIS